LAPKADIEDAVAQPRHKKRPKAAAQFTACCPTYTYAALQSYSITSSASVIREGGSVKPIACAARTLNF
jgi:hypothetical protein